MLNKILLQGRFTRDPELRRTREGTAVASFSLAVERDYKGGNGTREVDFIDCVTWRSTGEFVAKYFTKGRMAVIEGRMQSRTWTDDSGNKRKATEVVVDNAYFSDSKGKEQGAPPQEQYSQPPTYAPPSGYGQFGEFEDYGGELPL